MSSSIPLTSAVTSGDEQAVSALLANGADVNETTSGGQTALILAVIFGHTNLVQLLMNAGANPQLRDNLGLNAIEWAQRRGSTDAVAILTNNHSASTPPRKIVVPLDEPDKPAPQAPDKDERETVSEAEKSRRWISGFKQRLDEQTLRRMNRNEPPPEPRRTENEMPRLMTATTRQEPVAETHKAPEPEPPPPPVQEPPKITPPRILTPPPVETPAKGKRKRCPKCNAIYNGELVSYCAHHIVPLVDADEPIFSEPAPKNPPLFWILLIITLTGSIVAGSLITTYLYKSRQAATRSAAEAERVIQKGTPELSGELAGKSVLLPDAECPVKGQDPVAGSVSVHVMVDKKGQVYWARGSGGDWLMRGCANEAAMKSTFAPEKLRGREIEGTITYTFKKD